MVLLDCVVAVRSHASSVALLVCTYSETCCLELCSCWRAADIVSTGAPDHIAVYKIAAALLVCIVAELPVEPLVCTAAVEAAAVGADTAVEAGTAAGVAAVVCTVAGVVGPVGNREANCRIAGYCNFAATYRIRTHEASCWSSYCRLSTAARSLVCIAPCIDCQRRRTRSPSCPESVQLSR